MISGVLSSEKLLNIDRGLAVMGSDAVLRKILESVHVSLTPYIPEIWQALADADVKTVHRLLHDIKGYAPIFCSDALVEQIMQVEGLSRTETAAAVHPFFAELAPRLKGLLAEIRVYLA